MFCGKQAQGKENECGKKQYHKDILGKRKGNNMNVHNNDKFQKINREKG